MWGRKRIYMDTAAATPVDQRVLKAMRPFWRGEFGNPSSLHAEGLRAARAVRGAREQAARFLGARADEIIFTGGGTEANNLGLLNNWQGIITTPIEHPSVREAVKKFARGGSSRAESREGRVIELPVDEFGLVAPAALRAALEEARTAGAGPWLVSIIWAHNEFGTIQDVKALAKVIRDFKNVFLHLDACQAPRFLDCDVRRLGVDLLTLNSGKIYGPKGVGLLYARRGVPLAPRAWGGGQEGGLRSGTENVPGVVGFAAALELCAAARETESARLAPLRDRLIKQLLAIPDATLNGHATARLPNNVNFSFAGVEGEQLVLELDARGVAASAGSACAAPKAGGSYAIMALGRDPSATARAEGSLRLTLDRATTRAQVDLVSRELVAIIKKIRQHHARDPFAQL